MRKKTANSDQWWCQNHLSKPCPISGCIAICELPLVEKNWPIPCLRVVQVEGGRRVRRESLYQHPELLICQVRAAQTFRPPDEYGTVRPLDVSTPVKHVKVHCCQYKLVVGNPIQRKGWKYIHGGPARQWLYSLQKGGSKRPADVMSGDEKFSTSYFPFFQSETFLFPPR